MIALLSLLPQLAIAVPAPVRFELPNGLRVWVQEDHTRPVALVQITYKVGSINETAGATGVAHYVEHMVYRATQHIRNEDVYGYIDRIGGRYTGGTWPEFTRYAETVPSWALESALRVTAERMCCALFDSTEFERERHNVITEANGFSDTDPVSAFEDAVMATSFEAHPYRNNSNTWARDNLVLTRDETFEWYKRHYGPNNAVLVVVGDVDTGNVRQLVERHFASIQRAPESGQVRIVEPPQRVEKRVTLSYPGKAKRLEVLYRAPNAAHPDFPALMVLDRVLTLRLLAAMRPAGFLNELRTVDSATSYPYVYRISMTGDSSDDLDRLLAVVDSQIDRLVRAGVTSAELSQARNARNLSVTLQPDGQSSGVPPRRSYLTRTADQLSEREPQPWEVSPELREQIRAAATKVTAEDIQAYARQWLRRSQRTVGLLVTAADDFEPTWTDGRALVGERMEIPPLTTPPAKRLRPEPVPPRALQPLAPLGIQTARRVLPNGIVLRAARVRDTSGLHVRIRCECGTDSSLAMRAESVLRAQLRNAGPVRIVRDVARIDTGARFQARNRVLAAVDPAALAPANSGAVTVSIAGARDPAELLDLASPLAELPRTPRAQRSVEQGAPAIEERVAAANETQVAVVAGLPGVSRDDPDRRALELLNYIVGVPSYGGRLGWALTKAGLTYSSAATTNFGPARGHILFATKCDTRNTDSTIQAIREVIAGVGERGVAEWELREAQAFTLGRATLYGARDESGADAVAAALNESELSRVDLLDLPVLSRAYLSITVDDINRVARRYYRPELLKVVAVGAIPPAAQRRIFPDGTFRAIFEP